MNYDPSQLKNRIKIYEFCGKSDGAGGVVDNWSTKDGYNLIISRWSCVIPLSGKYLYEAKMAQEEITHDVIIRFNKMLLKYSAKKLYIDYNDLKLSVDYIIDIKNEHKFLKMRCTVRNDKNRC